MSPGTYTIRHMRRKDRKMQRKRLRVGQPDVKRRRLELKAERQSKNASQSVLEGTFLYWYVARLKISLMYMYIRI